MTIDQIEDIAESTGYPVSVVLEVLKDHVDDEVSALSSTMETPNEVSTADPAIQLIRAKVIRLSGASGNGNDALRS